MRRIREEDWALARALRLRALADDPDAFAATLAEERARSDEAWKARARSNAEGDVTAGFFALRDGVEVGMIVGVRTGQEIELNALWVAPEARGAGAGRALVAAVGAWASEKARAGSPSKSRPRARRRRRFTVRWVSSSKRQNRPAAAAVRPPCVCAAL